MTGIDYVILPLIVILAFWGFKRGLVRSFFALLGLGLGIKLASQYYDVVSVKLVFIPNTVAMKAAGFVIVLLAVMVMAWIAGSFIKKAISLFGLGIFDRIAGGVLGLAIGALASIILLAVMVNLPFLDLKEVVSNSKLASFLIGKLPFLLSLLPEGFRKIPSLLPFIQ